MRADWAALIRQLAPKYGVDPNAALAVASMEGLSGRVGDGGHAFGPFQLNDAGGVLTNRPGNHQAFAESPQGIAWALQRIGSVAGGLKGQSAVSAIVNKFERPAAPGPEIQGALANYGRVTGNSRVPAAVLNAAMANGGGSPAPAGIGGQQSPDMFRQLLASQMLQNAGNTISGGSGSVAQGGASLLQLAQMRSALQNANQLGLDSSSRTASTHVASAANHGSGGVTPNVRTLSGQFQMQTGGKSPYSNLRFANGVDWMHVNPTLLKAVNQAASSHGVVVDVNSGYRSNQHSLQVGGFAGDPHTKGIAIDAYVNGKPIGAVIPAATWKGLGVMSGDVPNFFHGQPDPEHLQLGS